MGDKIKTERNRRGQVIGYKGSEAGNDSKFKRDDVDADWQRYKAAKKLPFTAQRKDHNDAFMKWREGEAKKRGAAKAVKDATKATE